MSEKRIYDSERPRCWCGAYAEHAPNGISCDSCGDEIDADLDLRPSGYEWDGQQWVLTEDTNE